MVNEIITTRVEIASKNRSVISAMQSPKSLRLCACDGVILQETNPIRPTAPGCDLATTKDFQPNLYTMYVKKTGALPQPEVADTIGRLLGRQVKARDGKLYPRPTSVDKFYTKQQRDNKRAYHKRANQIANFKEALLCLEAIGNPAELAIHMKNDPEIRPSVEGAIAWLVRFAEEWHSREQSCRR